MDEGMTTVSRVKDQSMLKQVKAGDKIRFTAERGSEGITLTKIEKSK